MEKNLKEFIDEVSKGSPMKMLHIAAKLIELEAIENYLNLMYGIELDVKVRPAQVKEGRFYGKGIAEKL